MTPWTDLPGDPATRLLLIADHASNAIPSGLNLGVAAALMQEHVAWDIGVANLGAALCSALGCLGILGGVSRLVVDLNREEDAPGLIPAISDGHRIPANEALDEEERSARIATFWVPYHERISTVIASSNPRMLISLHSFTPSLNTDTAPRPWEIGILYNQDDRAPRIALPLLEAAGVMAGDNLPYSGKVLNATMNRHAEAAGLAYLGIEVRQDLIGDPAGVERWCERLLPIIRTTAGFFV